MKGAILAMGLAATVLSGCAVVSDTPLFGEDQAASHPLEDGLWALSGPGCEVRAGPTAALPDCAVPLSIEKGRMRWDTGAALVRLLGPGAQALSTLPTPKTSAYLLIDGDPAIVELLNGATNETPPVAAAAPPRPLLKPGYLALKVVHANLSGQVDKAVLWPILCPPDRAQPGFEATGAQCRVETAAALRERAAHLPPGLSYFMTWIREEADTDKGA